MTYNPTIQFLLVVFYYGWKESHEQTCPLSAFFPSPTFTSLCEEVFLSMHQVFGGGYPFFSLGGLASVGLWLSFLQDFCIYLRRPPLMVSSVKFGYYHPREYLPPPGQVPPVPFLSHYLSKGCSVYTCSSWITELHPLEHPCYPPSPPCFVFAVW